MLQKIHISNKRCIFQTTLNPWFSPQGDF